MSLLHRRWGLIPPRREDDCEPSECTTRARPQKADRRTRPWQEHEVNAKPGLVLVRPSRSNSSRWWTTAVSADLSWFPVEQCSSPGEPAAFTGLPAIVVEVLSPSTRRFDPVRKANDCRTLGIPDPSGLQRKHGQPLRLVGVTADWRTSNLKAGQRRDEAERAISFTVSHPC